MVLAGAGIYANAYDGDNIQPWLRSADTHRNNLEDDAKEVASDEGLAASEYWNERNELEYARACLIPKGTGINLGNTMDGHSSMTPGEPVWQSVVTTKYIRVRAVKTSGTNKIYGNWSKVVKMKI